MVSLESRKSPSKEMLAPMTTPRFKFSLLPYSRLHSLISRRERYHKVSETSVADQKEGPASSPWTIACAEGPKNKQIFDASSPPLASLRTSSRQIFPRLSIPEGLNHPWELFFRSQISRELIGYSKDWVDYHLLWTYKSKSFHQSKKANFIPIVHSCFNKQQRHWYSDT